MKLASLLLALVFAADVGDDPSQKEDRDRIQGNWEVKACHVGQREVTSPDGPQLMSFEGSTVFITRNGKRAEKGLTFELDQTKSPGTINLKSDGRVYKGIYELDGKRLRICYNADTRPTRFDAEERADEPYNVLYELERK